MVVLTPCLTYQPWECPEVMVKVMHRGGSDLLLPKKSEVTVNIRTYNGQLYCANGLKSGFSALEQLLA